ncbi:UNVERIFIED_CONTAM: hypothetical protein FKN15_031767 [Acipenser sinensis]
MACLQLTGFMISCFGWIGIIVATATNEWVLTCKYGVSTCKKMDELGARGLWADCIISTALYHCKSLNQILTLPAYIQTSRALMISASILGLPAILLVMMSLPCINLGSEPESIKYKRSVVGGVLILLIAICSIIPTVWFPIASHRESGLVTFGYSLYAGWIGAALCLFGGSMISCCSGDSPEYTICSIIPTVWFPIASHRESGLVTFGYSLYAGWIGAALCLFGGSMISCCSGDSPEYSENRYYYSKHRAAPSASPNHAKNAHV